MIADTIRLRNKTTDSAMLARCSFADLVMKKRIGDGCFAIVLLCCEVVFVIKTKGLCIGQTSLMSLKNYFVITNNDDEK